MIVRHLIIRGYVQGVFFRESMRQRAQALNVTGWVRNRRDGSVEAMLQGRPDAVETITEWARHGPAAATVENVETAAGWGDYTAFERRETE